MKRIITCILTVFLIISFCGCGNNTKTANTDNAKTNENVTVSVTEPVDDSVNGYRVSSPKTNTQSKINDAYSGDYYANKNSKKFHISTCGSVATIKNSNLYITSDREELINAGYSPCLSCNP